MTAAEAWDVALPWVGAYAPVVAGVLGLRVFFQIVREVMGR